MPIIQKEVFEIIGFAGRGVEKCGWDDCTIIMVRVGDMSLPMSKAEFNRYSLGLPKVGDEYVRETQIYKLT